MNGDLTPFGTTHRIASKPMPAQGLDSLFWLQPVVGSSHDTRSVILRCFYADAMQAWTKIGRAKRNEITIPNIPRCVHHPLFKPFVARKGRVFAAAFLSNFFGNVFLEGLQRHYQSGNHIHCPVVARVLQIMQKFRAGGRKGDAQNEHVRAANFSDQSAGFVCLLPWSRSSLIKSNTRRYSLG